MDRADHASIDSPGTGWFRKEEGAGRRWTTMICIREWSVPDADAFFPDFDEAEWYPLREARLRDADPACVLRDLVRRR